MKVKSIFSPYVTFALERKKRREILRCPIAAASKPFNYVERNYRINALNLVE